MYFVGIDIAKRFHEAAVIDEKGKIVIKRIKFQNSHSGYCKLMDAVKKRRANFTSLSFEKIFLVEHAEHLEKPSRIAGINPYLQILYYAVKRFPIILLISRIPLRILSSLVTSDFKECFSF